MDLPKGIIYKNKVISKNIWSHARSKIFLKRQMLCVYDGIGHIGRLADQIGQIGHFLKESFFLTENGKITQFQAQICWLEVAGNMFSYR
jgi:hypothetical protein